MSRNVFIALLLACVFGRPACAQDAAIITGQWTLDATLQNNAQDLAQLSIRRSAAQSSMSSSSLVPLNQLRGLTRAQIDSAGTMGRFELVREAGTLRFEGYLQKGGGGGTFMFSPNPNFATEMRTLGYADFSVERQFAIAVHDVSTAYIREMQALGIQPRSIDQLISMRIHNVTVAYVSELKALGYGSLTPDQLVTMRIHGASTEFVKEVAALGYQHPSIDQLVTMRIHEVTPDFIRKTRARGMGALSIDKLVTLRIHGVLD